LNRRGGSVNGELHDYDEDINDFELIDVNVKPSEIPWRKRHFFQRKAFEKRCISTDVSWSSEDNVYCALKY